MSKTCVINQPTFLPWLGWFDLADQSDVTILLDDVPFSKQSWQQRNQIRTPKGLEFLSVPVKTAGRLGQKITECEFVNEHFVGKMLKSLNANYAKAQFFAGLFDEFATVMETGAGAGHLADLNCACISWMAGKLGITSPMLRSSALGVAGERGEHVAALCESVGADRYLSPAGAEGYLTEDISAFDRRSISVWLQAYEHPEYAQRFAPFMPYASALDLIFNIGPGAPAVMRSGRRPPRLLSEHEQVRGS
jgi:hypothetical protein